MTEIGLAKRDFEEGRQNIRITEREIEALRFTLEMKFASVEALYQKFFRQEGSSNSRYAYERVNLLRKNGYLRPVRIHTEGTVYYVATQVVADLLQAEHPDANIPRALAGIDVRTFEHDRKVLLCRVVRESIGKARDWTSERVLRQTWSLASGGLPNELVPDAIFTNSRGERVAFELELSPKVTSRYFRKVERFSLVIHRQDGLFRRVLFVTCSPGVHKRLGEVCSPYKDSIFVVPFKEIVGGNHERA
ncbi:MAG: hypothetical protein V1495_00385 [Pseudomonadota bacterium]